MHHDLKQRQLLSAQDRALEALTRRGRYRKLAARSGRDFASNDYLGLAESDELKSAAIAALQADIPIGAGGSRLLRGNHPEHEALESEAAKFFGCESALYFGAGFTANTALFASLPRRGDFVIHDELIHASVHEGLAASKADVMPARHNDAGCIEDLIRTWRSRPGSTGAIWIAVESLYSMDGDCAPLDDLARLAERHDAMLVIDEAHATGVLGVQGRGLAAHLEGRANIVSLHTCGKALGVSGGLICAPRILTDYLINRSRAFIYATAPSPLLCSVVRSALRLIAGAHNRRAALEANRTHAARQFAHAFGHTSSGTHIEPILLGSDNRATSIAGHIQSQGFDVRAIRPPTVPEGTARLRIAITLNTTAEDISALTMTIKEALQRYPA